MKIVKKSLLQENLDARQRVEREIKVLRLLQHPFIMQMHDVMQTHTHLFVAVEHLQHGELYEYVSDRPSLTLDENFRFFYQLVRGVQYMHSQNICHRDLKLENLLLDSDFTLKIADFGMASAMPKGKYLETACGSPHYACPEIVKAEKYLGTEADAWSIGVILYALATSSLPFDDEDMEALFGKIRTANYRCPPEVPSDIQDLISRFLKVNGGDRISLDAVMRHKFWVSNINQLPKQHTEDHHLQLRQSMPNAQ